MNRSKGAAILMLVGAFAVGSASTYVARSFGDKPGDPNPCPQRTESRFKVRVYDDLSMDPKQRADWDSLIDSRNKAVNEVYQSPRAMAESIRAQTTAKQLALLTPEQLKKYQERQTAIQQRSIERRKLCESQSGKDKSNTSR